MAAVEFSITASNLAATSTPKTLLGFKAPANQAVKLPSIDLGFDGTDATKGPGLIELCSATFATNSPGGGNNSSVTPVNSNDRPETIQTTAASTWTVEPTVLTVIRSFLIPTCMGSAIAIPIDEVCKGGLGMVLRVTLPAAVTCNFTGTMNCEE